jgi:hypothetical protein
VKSLVRCAVNAADGAESKKLLECARDELIRKLPQQAQPLARCLVGGGSIPQCARTTILSQALKDAPPEARSFADCLLGSGDVPQCAQQVVTSRLLREAPVLAGCVAPGANVFQCTQSAINLKLPPDLKPLADCLLEGKTVAQCAQNEIVSKLPEEAKPLGNCLIRNGNVQACAQAELNSRLPAPVQGLSQCIAQGSQVVQCGRQFAAEQPALREAFATLERLKVDAATRLTEVPGSIQNILRVAQGIREDKWDQVAIYGGAEVYKAAAKLVLTYVIPGGTVLVPILAPVIDRIVQSRAELMGGVVRAAREGDIPRAASVIATFIMTLPFESACGLFDVNPLKAVEPNEVTEIRNWIREQTCGRLQRMIEKGGRIVSDEVQAGKDLLSDVSKNPLSLPAEAFNFLVDTFGIISRDIRKENDCGTSQEFYMARTAKCVPRQAYLNLTNPAQSRQVDTDLNGICRLHFDRCYDSSSFSGLCDPVRKVFNDQVNAAVASAQRELKAAAEAWYAPLNWYIALNSRKFCFPGGGPSPRIDLSEFTGQCVSQLERALPLADPMTIPDCGLASQPTGSPHGDACIRAFQQVDVMAVVREVCNACLTDPSWGCDPRSVDPTTKVPRRPHSVDLFPRLKPPPASALAPERGPPPSAGTLFPAIRPPPDVVRPPGQGPVSRFPDGTFGEQPPRSPPPALTPCRDGMVRNALGGCGCPEGTTFRAGRCLHQARDAACPPGRPVGSPPNCCPRGTQLVNGACRPNQAQCRPGMVPKAGGGCDCPQGSVFRGGTCITAACSGGMIGTPPNCRCPQGTVWRREGLGKARCLPPAALRAACPPGMARDSTGFCGPK